MVEVVAYVGYYFFGAPYRFCENACLYTINVISVIVRCDLSVCSIYCIVLVEELLVYYLMSN